MAVPRVSDYDVRLVVQIPLYGRAFDSQSGLIPLSCVPNLSSDDHALTAATATVTVYWLSNKTLCILNDETPDRE